MNLIFTALQHNMTTPHLSSWSSQQLRSQLDWMHQAADCLNDQPLIPSDWHWSFFPLAPIVYAQMDCIKQFYVTGVQLGHFERSLLDSSRFHRGLDRLEKIMLGPWARSPSV